MAKLGLGLRTLLWAFINATWTTARRKDFWSPFGFVQNWCNCQQYTNPRLSTFMIKLQYHFLPLKLGFRSDKAQSTKSTPPIHLLYALMAWGCNMFTLPLPHLHHFTFPTGSTLTALLPTDTTLLSFHRISSIWWPDVKYRYSPLSIFLNSLIHFSGQQSVVCPKGTRCFEAIFRKSFHELVQREVVKKNMVIRRISTRGKWQCNKAITQGFVTITTVTLINCYTIWKTSTTC